MAAMPPLVFASDPWPPWATGEYGKTEKGIAVAIVREAFSRLNRPTHFVLHPWQRVLKMLSRGQVDGLTFVHRQAELDDQVYYSIPIFSNRTVVCYDTRRFLNFSWSAFSDLAPYRIGLTRGYDYGAFSRAAATLELRISEGTRIESNLRALLAGRTDIVIGNESAIRTLIARHAEFTPLTIHAKSIDAFDFHIGLSRRNLKRHDLVRLDAVLSAMIQDGTMARLRQGPASHSKRSRP